MKRNSVLSLSLLTLGLLTLPTLSVLAQSSGIKISPIRVDKMVDPGDAFGETIIVTNLSDVDRTFYFYINDFQAGSGESGTAEIVPPGSTDEYSLASWVKITGEGIRLSPGEKREVSYTIQVPDSASPGGHYGAIVVAAQSPDVRQAAEERGAAISISQQTGCLVLLKVSGETIEKAMIRDFNVGGDINKSPINANFIARVENMGNVHLKPHGTIDIKNMFGKKVAILRVNDEGSNVLPSSVRRFETIWEENFGFGRYTASLALSFGTFASEGGQGRQTIYSDISFWVLPWNIIIPVALGIVFFATLFVLFLKLYRNKAVEKALKKAGLAEVKYVKKYEGLSPTLYLGLTIILILSFVLLVGAIIFFLFFA